MIDLLRKQPTTRSPVAVPKVAQVNYSSLCTIIYH